MKLVLFSDLHAHNFVPYSQQLANGRNSRLQNALDVIAQVRDVAAENNAHAIMFLGDLFHARFRLDVDVLSCVVDELRKVAKEYPLYVLRGNHDTFDTLGQVHSLAFESKNVCVIDQPTLFSVSDPPFHSNVWQELVAIYALPWLESAEAIRAILKSDKCCGDILLMHCGLAEGTVGPSDKKVDAKLSVSDLPLDKFKWVFLGDYHKHQELVPNKVMYCGSPLQLNFGERNEKKYILVLDTGTGNIAKVETKAPKFYEFESVKDFETAVNSGKVKPDYDHVRVLYPATEAGSVTQLTQDFGDVKFERQTQEFTQARGTSDILSNDSLLIRDYVDTIPDMQDREMVCSYGLDVLEGID